MNQYARMIIVLVIISMASGAVLALSYEATNPKIQEQARQKLEQSVLVVIPGATLDGRSSKRRHDFLYRIR
jgi:electron transport complex protein RnfG